MAANAPVSAVLALIGWLLITADSVGRCLPPPEDVPEEIMRTELITDARSPIDGKPLSAGEYAALLDTLQDPNRVGLVSPALRDIVYLLQIRRVVKPILPILP